MARIALERPPNVVVIAGSDGPGAIGVAHAVGGRATVVVAGRGPGPLDVDGGFSWVPTNDPTDAVALASERRAGIVVAPSEPETLLALAANWQGPLVLWGEQNSPLAANTSPATAGRAAALVGTGRVASSDVSTRLKRLTVTCPDGQVHALVSVEAVSDAAPSHRVAVVTIADPVTRGIAGVAGSLTSCRHEDMYGVTLEVGTLDGAARAVDHLDSDGRMGVIDVASCVPLPVGFPIDLLGPTRLFIDGADGPVLEEDDRALVWVGPEGPWLVDAEATLAMAVRLGLLIQREPRPHAHLRAVPRA